MKHIKFPDSARFFHIPLLSHDTEAKALAIAETIIVDGAKPFPKYNPSERIPLKDGDEFMQIEYTETGARFVDYYDTMPTLIYERSTPDEPTIDDSVKGVIKDNGEQVLTSRAVPTSIYLYGRQVCLMPVDDPYAFQLSTSDIESLVRQAIARDLKAMGVLSVKEDDK